MKRTPVSFSLVLLDPNPEGRLAVFRGLGWAIGCSTLLWWGMFEALRTWGWWGPPGVMAGGTLALVVVGLATRVAAR